MRDGNRLPIVYGINIVHSFSLPMRDGNESAESEAITSESGFSLPMRDGNQTLCCQMGLVIRF